MVLLTFLVFAELVNGLSLVVAAIGRTELVMTNNFTIPTTPKTCMLEKLWPVAPIIAGKLLSLLPRNIPITP
uniref:Secreted protein n=1 Tax=Parascaris equorum TaxID=6256 RepID=A0A914RCJ0_PAREQ